MIQIRWRRLFGPPPGVEFAEEARHVGAQTGTSSRQVVTRQKNRLAHQPSAKQRGGELDRVMVKQRKGITRCFAEQPRPGCDTSLERAPRNRTAATPRDRFIGWAVVVDRTKQIERLNHV